MVENLQISMKKYTFVPALIAAAILAQTLYFKFTAHTESVALFTTLGVEPWGRIATGIFELIAAFLLLLPPTRLFGGIAGIGLMSGAIASHLLVLGIESAGDGGTLFALAWVVMFCCAAVVFLKRQELKEKLALWQSKFR